MSGHRNLWHAVREQNLGDIAANLMDTSVDIDATGGKYKTTPIIEAVRVQNLSIVEWLVECNANIFATDVNNNNAVMHSYEIKPPSDIADSIQHFMFTTATQSCVVKDEPGCSLSNFIADFKHPERMMSQCQQVLCSRLKLLGLSMRDCGGDGDCLFNSVADQLCLLYPLKGEPKFVTGNDLRQSVCAYIKKRILMKNLFPMDGLNPFDMICEADQKKHRNADDPFNSYMNELELHGWGGSFVIKMLAIMMEIPIRVWTSKPRIAGNNRDYDEFLIEGKDGTEDWDGDWIVIANETDLHFQSVSFIGDPRPGLCEILQPRK